MSVGRYAKEDRILLWQDFFGLDAGAAVTAVIMTMDSQSITPFSFCPAVPRAMKCTKIAINASCAADTVPGNWTMRFRVDESFADSATASFACSTGFNKTAVNWSSEVIIQAGSTYYITADGPQKNQVVIRAVCEFEVI